MQLLSLDQLIDSEHRVRVVWQYVESLDLSELYQSIKATVDNVGRDPVDPESRRMKMGDSGTRPAMNAQFASDGDAKMVVAVEIISQGSDNGLMKPMYDGVAERFGVTPKEYLVDGGFCKKEDITHVEQQGTEVLAPLYAEQKQLAADEKPILPPARAELFGGCDGNLSGKRMTTRSRSMATKRL